MTCAALDIGGANIKVALADGTARSIPFALWKDPGGLEAELRGIVDALPAIDRLAVTMTGELCDCFATRAEGVRHILDSIEKATPVALRGSLRIWSLEGALMDIDSARAQPDLIGAANWLALATWAAHEIDGAPGLLLDIGSTTTDIVTLEDGAPRCLGRTDTERLLSGELVYTGVERTPLCAVLQEAPYRGHSCPVAAELFATTLDAYLVLEKIAESPLDTNTADGRAATREHAEARLARTLCADRTSFTREDAIAVADATRSAQGDLITRAAKKVLSSHQLAPRATVISGAGEFLARDVAARDASSARIISLAETAGEAASLSAPAFALARMVAAES